MGVVIVICLTVFLCVATICAVWWSRSEYKESWRQDIGYLTSKIADLQIAIDQLSIKVSNLSAQKSRSPYHNGTKPGNYESKRNT